MQIASEVAKKLLQIKAIKLSPQTPFTWASGIKSPIYCDNRILLSYPDIRNFIKKAFVLKSEQFEPFDVVAGVATAGIPHGALLADTLGKPFVYVRSQAKEHGRQNLIEGNLVTGSRVLVIEDLISTGGSSLKVVDVIRESGCNVVGVLAIFSYELEEAKTAFEVANCRVEALSNYSTLIEEAQRNGQIEPAEMDTLKLWRKDPHQWGASLVNN